MKLLPAHIIGRTGTVLVFEQGSETKAVVSWVIATATRCRARPRLTIKGSVRPDRNGLRQLRGIVLPLVNEFSGALELPRHGFELSFAQLGIASSLQRPLTLAGHSIDLPVLLAMLSSLLQLALPQDLVCTGQIGSAAGDVRMVAHLEAKLNAARAQAGIRRFVFPHPDADSSMQVLAPGQRQELMEALLRSTDGVKQVAIRSVAELLQAVLDDEQLVLAALRSGYFHLDGQVQQDAEHALAQASAYLCRGNADRFWRVLERHLAEGRNSASRRLLGAYVHYHVKRKQYPKEFGLRLRQLRDSLPEAIRNLKLKWPLLPVARCVELARHAGDSDAQDVQHLFAAVSGQRAMAAPESTTSGAVASKSSAGASAGAKAAVEALVEVISPRALAQRVGAPIQVARLGFTLPSATVESGGQLIDVVSRLYFQFLRHYGEVSADSDEQSCRDEAHHLLDSAFAEEGGFRAALAEARWPVRGGLLYVLNQCTEHHTRVRQARFVERSLKEAIPTDWRKRVEFMTALLCKLNPHLPEELRRLPPERFADADTVAAVVRAYVQSLERVKQVIRCL